MMMEERFENRLNKDNIKFRTLNPVWDNEVQDGLNVFEMIELLNKQDQRINVLENEIMDFQELLTKEDTVCHERVSCLIDDYIWQWEDEGSPVADEFRKLKRELME